MIFNGEMVRAILDGRKTQTRRPVKLPHIDRDAMCELSGNELAGELSAGNYRNSLHGKPGDRIWVRETSGLQVRRDALGGTGEFRVYRASAPDAIRYTTAEGKEVPLKWTPSIHMPRHACRILLEITGIRIERLASISDDDAGKEGYPANPATYGGDMDKWLWFRQLWDSIYPDQSFKHNPWVWVIEFKVVPNVQDNPA
ncbi:MULTISPECIES: morphogenetic protein [Citrobacter]|uniref:morphogenetic protein n=1 Tax=Citrobacter TaxID=544 RepID=UPI001484E97C|nr:MULTISPECIES: morphogenetic protein [Citrobacter]HEI8402090.1 morphogenetic protein [Citrobacter freundii]